MIPYEFAHEENENGHSCSGLVRRAIMNKADDLIARLQLVPHPEGGYFRQTFLDSDCYANGRACSTAIYYLLKQEDISQWHSVDAVEVWHWYAGDPLILRISHDGKSEKIILGSDIHAGHAPQAIVPKHAWQSAQSLGEYTLAGCTVAPGFMFEGFTLADEKKRDELDATIG